jgi:hypothetical protein
MKKLLSLTGLPALVGALLPSLAAAHQAAEVAYYCAVFTNPTVEQIWSTVCYLPCRLHGGPCT